jgi:hypothetical protein
MFNTFNRQVVSMVKRSNPDQKANDDSNGYDIFIGIPQKATVHRFQFVPTTLTITETLPLLSLSVAEARLQLQNDGSSSTSSSGYVSASGPQATSPNKTFGSPASIAQKLP